MAKKRKKGEWDGTNRRGPAPVLIAGENAAANELLRRVLESRGYSIITAESTDGAVGRTSDHLPRAAVLDLSSTGVGSSMQVLDSIRHHDDERVRACRVIIVARSKANRNFAFQSGADGYLLRPYHVDELQAMIEETLSIPPDERALYRRKMLDAG